MAPNPTGESAHVKRAGAPLTVALPVLGAATVVAIALCAVRVPVSPPGALPWIIAVALALAVMRIIARRKGHDRSRFGAYYAANLVVSALAVFLSPAFGLYLFLSFYEASMLKTPIAQNSAVVATAAVVAVAQTGGPQSDLFAPLPYLAFFAITVAIALVMTALDSHRERLIRTVEKANEELRAERELTATLTSQLVEQARAAGIAEERKRLSREIHDTVAQDLVAIIAQLASVEPNGLSHDAARRLHLADESARAALTEARRAVAALASPRLDNADLPLAIDDVLGQWRAATGIETELVVQGFPVSSSHDDALLRIAQEALANTWRHAHADRVTLTLTYSGSDLVLSVADDGIGFNVNSVQGGYGLSGMKARMDAMGGNFHIHSTTGEGTKLTATLPLRESIGDTR